MTEATGAGSILPVRRRDTGDGSMILSYKISSWVILRLYGAALVGFAWLLWQGEVELSATILSFAWGILPVEGIAGGIAALGALLVIPFLTPRILRFPRSVLGGVAKAVLMVALSALVYFGALEVIASDFFRWGNLFADVIPLFIKALAGISITGAILVSLPAALASTHKGAPGAGEVGAKLSDTDLRKLRRARMG